MSSRKQPFVFLALSGRINCIINSLNRLFLASSLQQSSSLNHSWEGCKSQLKFLHFPLQSGRLGETFSVKFALHKCWEIECSCSFRETAVSSFNGTSQPTGSSHRLFPHRDARRVELQTSNRRIGGNNSCCLDDVDKRRVQARSAIFRVWPV